jgi:hypothetical protein
MPMTLLGASELWRTRRSRNHIRMSFYRWLEPQAEMFPKQSTR